MLVGLLAIEGKEDAYQQRLLKQEHEHCDICVESSRVRLRSKHQSCADLVH